MRWLAQGPSLQRRAPDSPLRRLFATHAGRPLRCWALRWSCKNCQNEETGQADKEANQAGIKERRIQHQKIYIIQFLLFYYSQHQICKTVFHKTSLKLLIHYTFQSQGNISTCLLVLKLLKQHTKCFKWNHVQISNTFDSQPAHAQSQFRILKMPIEIAEWFIWGWRNGGSEGRWGWGTLEKKNPP